MGTSSGYITSNYNSSSERATGDYSSDSVSSFVIRNDNANGSFQGSMIINKSSSNSYSEIGQFKKGSGSAVDCYGTLSSVSGVVDRLKVSIGSGNFDAGLIGLSYKTSGSGSGNYNSSILSANGTNELEFTDIPSWATKVTLIAENILLPQTDSDEVGFNLEFGDLVDIWLQIHMPTIYTMGLYRMIIRLIVVLQMSIILHIGMLLFYMGLVLMLTTPY